MLFSHDDDGLDAIGLRQQVANATADYRDALSRIVVVRTGVEHALRLSDRHADDAVTCASRRLIHAGGASGNTRRLLVDELSRRKIRDPDAVLRSAPVGPVRVLLDDRERAALSAVLGAVVELRRDVRAGLVAPALPIALPRTLDGAKRAAANAVRDADQFDADAGRYLRSLTARAGTIVAAAQVFAADYGEQIERDRRERRGREPSPDLAASWSDWANIADRAERVRRACTVRTSPTTRRGRR